ncbi:MAG: YidC/Oxa1 family membrane protein insertase [Actinobacteria bacterium]|nr:YidC/Oxa1 family membrane protein insertase [Actinomycetota bacterium]
MLDSLARMIGLPMSLFYDVIPNYGISIIFLTLLINLILFPLTLKQTRSTRAMQEIQPEVKKLQKKHKEEPELLNKAMMALYKEKGVSPAGCVLPMLVQMPIWFGLFRLLRSPEKFMPEGSNIIHALQAGLPSFLGMDLGVTPKDALSSGWIGAIPYLLVVLLVIGSGWIQSKQAMPASSDGAGQQAQMMTKMMPLLFGVFSFSFPAGLNLYFVTSNLFRIGQQSLIFRLDGRPAAPKVEEQEVEEKPEGKHQGSRKKRKRRRRK